MAQYGRREGMELRVETEMIDVTSLGPKPDKTWRYTDRHGHEHRYVDDRYVDGGYPTLIVVDDETWWCDDCEDAHTESHRECRECGERIEPGMTGPSMAREYAPGMTRYFLGDEEISRERYLELAARSRRRPEGS